MGVSIVNKVNSIADRVSNHDAWSISKPWIETIARTAGIKSFYDVPEYFRERFELRGVKVGGKQFGGGLSGATQDLLAKNQSSKKSEVATGNREVRDAINRVNKKLALTKEGSVKGSEARNKMAKILRENRTAKQINNEKVGSDVKNVLDNYTNQKVDGVTAAREALRTGLTATGTRNLMGAGNAALNVASFIKTSAQKARREGKDFNTNYLASEFSNIAKDKWGKLINKNSSLTDRLNSISSIAGVAGSLGVEGAGDISTVSGLARSNTRSSGMESKANDNRTAPNRGEVGRDGSIRKIVTEERKTVGVETRKQGRNFAANDPRYQQTTDEAFNASYAKQGVQPISLDDKSVKNTKNSEGEYIKEPQRREVPRNTQANRKEILASQSLKKESKLKVKMRVRSLNLAILSIAGSLWLVLQKPFAILSLIFFGLAVGLEEAERVLLEETPEDGFFVGLARAAGRLAVGTVRAGVDLINTLTGIDLSLLHPQNFFLLTLFFIISFFAIFQLLVIYLIYTFFNINSLSGDWEGFKKGALILCFIGYSTPLLNLFPWFIVWTTVVWLKPK